MKKLFAYLAFLALSLAALTAHAADWAYTSFGTIASYGVTGPFNDNIDFTVVTAGTYQISVYGNKQIIACSGRYCRSPGTLIGTITSATLQSSPISFGNNNSVTPVSMSLAAGAYVLNVVGVGQGTGKYPAQGSYSVKIVAPAAPPTCDSLHNLMLTQGYSEAYIEQYIAGLQAQIPPGCTGD